MYATYTEGDFVRVKSLQRLGYNSNRIANWLRIPRSTVRNWGARETKPSGARVFGDGFPADPGAFSYLLGIYLGDGHLFATGPRTLRLGITLDRQYPGIVSEVQRAIRDAYPGIRVCVNNRPGAACVYASGIDWATTFPQHGPGRKHTRRILLADWQSVITQQYPEAFLRGLIHSDGSRCINRFQTKLPSGRVATYAYPRYFFTNVSADIRRIFCDHCDLLGIRWTQSNSRNISIAHRHSVALMDEFIGPKS